METVTITLDGREVSGYPGMTILDLARESGVEIPTLCHDPCLPPAGACRVCLVEDERTGALLASCVAPIAPGMIINTRSDRVTESRKTIVKLMLASHPDSCLVCDKGNRCQLRQVASDMGIGLLGLQRLPQTATIDEVNPFLERDLSKCILCAKCIRACQDLVVQGAVDYFQRGFATRPATLSDLPLEDSECTFCGTCVALCPTGALTEKDKSYRGTSATVVSTTCPFCGCGCGLRLEVKDNSIVRVTPDRESTINNAALCVKGSYGCDFVHSTDRLTTPLVRRNHALEPTSWDEALELVATRFREIRDAYGSSTLAVLGSSKCTNEENYLLQRFARTALGTNNIDNGSRLYSSAARVGLGSTVGSYGSTTHLSDLERSQVIMVFGADPSSSAPIVEYAVKRAVKKGSARLILVDPRRTSLAPFAHIWLRPRPGTDVALINGLAKVIADEGLLDEEFVARRTDNFEAFVHNLQAHPLELVEEVAGVPLPDVCTVARLYATADRTAIVCGTGITQHPNATDTVKALANLALLTGNAARAGGGILVLQQDNNGQGACDMGALPDFFPGYQSVTDARARERFQELWGVELPANPGLSALEIVDNAHQGSTKGIYVVGENPVLSFPQSQSVANAMASLDFLVVQDIFLTETARLANVVLPAASFAEKEGTFTNFEGRLHAVQPAIGPVGESLPDSDILLRLSRKMDAPMPYSSIQQVMNEIADISGLPAYSLYQGPDYSRAGPTSPSWPGSNDSPWDTALSHGGQFLKGFARFCPVEWTPQRKAGSDYPLTLLTGATLCHHGTGTRSSRAPRLSRFHPHALLELGASDATGLGIGHGDRVRVVSPVGQVTATVRITDALSQGACFLPTSFPDTPVNQLFASTMDPEAKAPSLKACSVRIERTAGDE